VINVRTGNAASLQWFDTARICSAIFAGQRLGKIEKIEIVDSAQSRGVKFRGCGRLSIALDSNRANNNAEALAPALIREVPAEVLAECQKAEVAS
jgi:hypothetical protein